jgi:hypothetical protein
MPRLFQLITKERGSIQASPAAPLMYGTHLAEIFERQVTSREHSINFACISQGKRKNLVLLAVEIP